LRAESDLIAKAMQRVSDLEALSEQTNARLDAVEHYIQAYRQYCWPVTSLDDLNTESDHSDSDDYQH
jgi:protein phosphatase